ncbi:hypothetical protein NEUTE1DRAFT_103118 [Neurospora tetrasperma FGSC 2508]|uniref:Uncharacterized protein n=1 Tax=Neurospora tetrasperma (strain FGSC 2508 / ATCC MYA-4615 / P0657) TaxID=510951 RepID=F8MUM6_NEUT8|nr:uncharacterized protein NEUTE1DRAFT_103118 [Neurospora tetrasperma FGSC 2508]EGO55708.1 hypothetical protein NEUTE1DRAFT_103118 [Neurospora tetrasperma FGSC 2508]
MPSPQPCSAACLPCGVDVLKTGTAFGSRRPGRSTHSHSFSKELWVEWHDAMTILVLSEKMEGLEGNTVDCGCCPFAKRARVGTELPSGQTRLDNSTVKDERRREDGLGRKRVFGTSKTSGAKLEHARRPNKGLGNER